MGVYDGDSVLKLILERLYRLDFLFEYPSTFSSAENCDSLEACMLFERILQQVNGCDYVLFFMALLGLLGSIFSGISWYGNHLLLQLKSGWFMERKVEREQYMCCYCCKVFNFWSKCIKPHTFNTSTIFYHGFCQMHLKTSIHLLLKQWGDTGKLYVKISERNKLVLQIFPKKCEFLSVFFLPVPTVVSSNFYLLIIGNYLKWKFKLYSTGLRKVCHNTRKPFMKATLNYFLFGLNTLKDTLSYTITYTFKADNSKRNCVLVGMFGQFRNFNGSAPRSILKVEISDRVAPRPFLTEVYAVTLVIRFAYETRVYAAALEQLEWPVFTSLFPCPILGAEAMVNQLHHLSLYKVKTAKERGVYMSAYQAANYEDIGLVYRGNAANVSLTISVLMGITETQLIPRVIQLLRVRLLVVGYLRWKFKLCQLGFVMK
ncbi:uncharacterized protein LOC113341453 [Papaver somniferum]|uniref:uncharacterized protein LOC113341453 n=1 Tax=Papaver somniferum TaxID=3469 RepID=UPI000E703355|nr:uncharacterized protein LOC113341453 [Papaver somniferum]